MCNADFKLPVRAEDTLNLAGKVAPWGYDSYVLGDLWVAMPRATSRVTIKLLKHLSPHL